MSHSSPSSALAGRGPWWLVSLLALALAACGPEVPPQSPAVPEQGGVSQEAPLSDVRLRLVAANITSGNKQSYDPGEGIHIFQGIKPDVAMIQEFNYGTNSTADIRSFVDTAFGADFSYYRGAGGVQIPNGVISRYPILAAGDWTDTQVSNRAFTWARIDIPGPTDLWAVSVHLLTSGSGVRSTEATNLTNLIKANVPAGSFVVIGGDFNSDSNSESLFSSFSSVVSESSPYPADKSGNINTNANRNKPYDHVLVSSNLRAYQTSVVMGSSTFASGLVVDTRVYSPLSDISPAVSSDSASTNMQHMAVVKDFFVPADGTVPASVAVVAPNGGESLTGGANKAITWTSSGVTNVKLEYTTDGSTWSLISASTPATPASYTWVVPNVTTSAARVRVSDATNAALSDTSDVAFTITATTSSDTTTITQEAEPNDTLASASGRVAVGLPVSGTISTSTDVDWLRFAVTTPGTVTVSLDLPTAASLTWYLYAESNPRVYLARGFIGSSPQVATYDAPAAGNYYVRVVGYAGATGTYSLTVTGAGVKP